jgi:hypothetical protein
MNPEDDVANGKDDEKMVKVKVSYNTKTGEITTQEVSEEEYNKNTNGGTENLAEIVMAPKGINGGFSVTNNSNQGITIFGNSVKYTDKDKEESPTNRVLLMPGEKFVATYKYNSNPGGYDTQEYDGSIVDAKTGETRRSNVGIYDVDGIIMSQNQNFIDNSGNVRNTTNTNFVKDLPGEIKLGSNWADALLQKFGATPNENFRNKGNVNIDNDSNGNLKLTSSGSRSPSIIFGQKK